MFCSTKMASALNAVDFAPQTGRSMPGLVEIRPKRPSLPIDEEIAVRQAEAIGDIDYVYFRRFSDGRSSQVAAYVIDNSDERFSKAKLAEIHKRVWLNGSAPLLYIGWQTQVDVLSCARGPDFWHDDDYRYFPAQEIQTAAQISRALQERFSAFRLADGTFWDDPKNSQLAAADKAAHRRLIKAVVDTDADLDGDKNPVLRRLLLLTVLIKHLEDRGVFPSGWFAQSHDGANSFFEVLKNGTADEVRELLAKLERKFNGDVFELPENSGNRLTNKELRHFADLVEAKTIKSQRYLWDQFSFRYIPVEVISHLYQRFTQKGKGAVFTPPFLANLMLDYALPYKNLTGKEKIFDPTCGSGVFLVGAFRRLIHFWRSKNHWQAPDVQTLKTLLKQSIFGVELQEEAVHLTAFSLALAVCDALQPNVIWKELRFDKIVGSNLLTGDFFDQGDKVSALAGTGGFAVVIGNPPFLSKLTDAAKEALAKSNVPDAVVPDNQMAYFIAHQAMPLLKTRGRMCLLQPAGFLYNEKARPFQKSFMEANQVEAVLDFTSIRQCFDGADPKTIALVVSKEKPSASHRIQHYTFRRTFSVQERIGFELDHYDRHLIPQHEAEEYAWVWRVNLVGGGRLHHLTARLQEMPTLNDYIAESGWTAGEGFIAGESGKRPLVKWLTNKPFLPTEALSIDGIDSTKINVVRETHFTAPRTELRYAPPLALLKEHESLPCAFWNDGFLAYKHKIVGIHAEPKQEKQLRQFCREFSDNREALRAFCILLGTQALVGKATAILKRDIDVLPWPTGGASWDLSEWEKILCEDVVNYTAEFVRLGQKSRLLKQRVANNELKEYADVFVKMLGSIYNNLRAAKSGTLNGITFQAFCFGKTPQLDWPADWTQNLHELIYVEHGAALRTVRVLRFYDSNVVIIVKPDRLRYWIRSTAIRDADETLVDLEKQGY
jgi:type I restriction-modification system DNA methylase subunit